MQHLTERDLRIFPAAVQHGDRRGGDDAVVIAAELVVDVLGERLDLDVLDGVDRGDLELGRGRVERLVERGVDQVVQQRLVEVAAVLRVAGVRRGERRLVTLGECGADLPAFHRLSSSGCDASAASAMRAASAKLPAS